VGLSGRGGVGTGAKGYFIDVRSVQVVELAWASVNNSVSSTVDQPVATMS